MQRLFSLYCNSKMAGDILIVKRKHGKVSLKITKQMRSGYTPDNTAIVINLADYKDVSLFLQDLKDLYNVPIDKAIKYYQSEASTWPFS